MKTLKIGKVKFSINNHDSSLSLSWSEIGKLEGIIFENEEEVKQIRDWLNEHYPVYFDRYEEMKNLKDSAITVMNCAISQMKYWKDQAEFFRKALEDRMKS